MTKNATSQESGIGNTGDEQIEIVRRFIDEVWNANSYGQIGEYLHPEFVDHSMPFKSFQNQNGLLLYLKQMAQTVCHSTEILDITTMDELVICKIRIAVRYLTEINSTYAPAEVIDGHRIFKMHESKIVAHWEMI